jgi:hypothetical protein
MLLHLIAFGIVATAALEPGSGDVVVPAAQTVVLKPGTASTGTGTGIPPSAAPFARPLDPSDHAPYAFDFSEVLEEGENIASIERFQVTATAAALGVMVDSDPDFLPVIDHGGKIIGVWFKVDPLFEFNTAFSSPGVKAGIAIKIKTDSAQPKTFERTGVLSVIQQ